MSQADSLDYTHLGLFTNPSASWFTPISITIHGITPVQAASIPAPRFNSVCEVVNYVRF